MNWTKAGNPELVSGFNGKENDREWGTGGLTQDYGFRLYNSAIAKFLGVDPLAPNYPWYTPYQFAGNKPISSIDLDGLEDVDYRFSNNKLWTFFRFTEASVGGGIGSALLYKRQEGTAYDVAGITQYSLFQGLYGTNQYRSLSILDIISGENFTGGEAALVAGIKFDKRVTFLDALDGAEISPFTKNDAADITSFKSFGNLKTNVKAKFGGGFGFSENNLSLTMGPSVGLQGSRVSDDVIQSISITEKESREVGKFSIAWFPTWGVGKRTPNKDGKGNTLGFLERLQ